MGAASGVKIAALRVANSSGIIYISYVIDAIDYAEDVGIPILNISLGIDPEKRPDNDLLSALREVFGNYSGLLVCAAGNDTTNTDYTPSYPASFTNDNIIAVGANRANGEKKTDSNYGATSVDVFAPGENILSCYPTSMSSNYSNGYHKDGGTSMAAPYVTAIAALMLSQNPSLTPQQIKNRIIATCIPSPYLTNQCVSDGIVNACYAVLSAYPSTPMTADSSQSISISAGQERWIKFVVPSSGIYSFFTSGSHHTVGELFHYTMGLRERSSNASSTNSSNFYIEEHLTAGTTVYLRVTLKQASASGSFTLYIASP